METCRTLKEYARYVDMVRKYAREKNLAEAVETAVDTCIREGILSDFLKKHRAEAIEMSIFVMKRDDFLSPAANRKHCSNSPSRNAQTESSHFPPYR